LPPRGYATVHDSSILVFNASKQDIKTLQNSTGIIIRTLLKVVVGMLKIFCYPRGFGKTKTVYLPFGFTLERETVEYTCSDA